MAFRRTIHVGLFQANTGSQIRSLTSDDPTTWNEVDLDLEVPESSTISHISATRRGDYVSATVTPTAGGAFLRVWNRSGNNPYTQIANVGTPPGDYTVRRTEFSPDRAWLAVALATASQGNSRVQIYSVANTGITLANTISGNTGFTGNMPTLTWTPNSDAVLVGGIYGPRVYDWSGSNLTLRSNAIYPAFTGNISSADFSADGESVAFASPGNVTVYDTTVTPWAPRSVVFDARIQVVLNGVYSVTLLGEIDNPSELPPIATVPADTGFLLRGSPDVYYIKISNSSTNWDTDWSSVSYNTKYPRFNPPGSGTLWSAGDVKWIGNVGLGVLINGNLSTSGSASGHLEVYNWTANTATLTWNYQNYPWSGNGEPVTMATNPTSTTVYLEGYQNFTSGNGTTGVVQILDPTETSWTDQNYYTIRANVNVAGTLDTQSIVSVEGVLHQGNLDLQSTAVMRAQRTYVGNVDEYDDPYVEFGYMELGLVGQILRSRPILQAVADTEETVVAGYIEPDYFYQVLTPGERIRTSPAAFEANTELTSGSDRIRAGSSDISAEVTLSGTFTRIRTGESAQSAQLNLSADADLLRRADAALSSAAALVAEGNSSRDVSVSLIAESQFTGTATRIQSASASLLSENFAAITAQAQRNFVGDLRAETAMTVSGEAGYFGRANLSVTSEVYAFGFAPEILRSTAHLDATATLTAIPDKIQVGSTDLDVAATVYINAGIQADADANLAVTAALVAVGRSLQFIQDLQLRVPQETSVYPVLGELRTLSTQQETRVNTVLPEQRSLDVEQETRTYSVI